MTAQEVKRVRYFVHGEPRVSDSQDFFNIYDASTGEVIAQVPDCTEKEVDLAVQSAKDAFPAWADTPPMKRVQVLFKFRELIERHLSELTRMVATEHGK